MPNPKKPRNTCLNCGKECERWNYKYCSNACQHAYQRAEYIARWKAGEVSGLAGDELLSDSVRFYLFEKYNGQCSQCGWRERNPKTGRVPLTVDHIDGDWANNREENLRLLCPNCHSLTETYMNLNRGHGRTYRRKFERRKTDLF